MNCSLLGATLALGLVLTAGIAQAAQAQTGIIRVEVVHAAAPVAGATVSSAGRSATTDPSGVARLDLPAGRASVVATKDGYERATAGIDIVAGRESTVRIVLTPAPAGHDKATIATTRTGRPFDEQAVPVDVLTREALDASMSPGDVAGALGEISGL